MNFLSHYYLYIKAFHIISVISWMAGLLYLPRLFVYHFSTNPGSEASEKFKIMEYKLTKIIILPSMLLTLVFGIMLLSIPGLINWSAGWLHAKLFLVLCLYAYNGILLKWQKKFANDERFYSETYFRIANEIPAVIMILIVVLVVVKPF